MNSTHSALAPPLRVRSRKMSVRMTMIIQIHANSSMNQNIETMTSHRPKSSSMDVSPWLFS
jgi:hypothetical protein